MKIMVIKTVIRLPDNMVMVFDECGEQVPWYQGRYEDVKEQLFRDAPTDAIFNHWFGNGIETEAVSRVNW